MELIAILIIVAAVIFIEQLVFRKNVMKGLSYTVHFNKHEAFEGETFEIVEEIVNDKKLPVPWAKTELCTSRWLDFSGTNAQWYSDTRFVASVFALKPHQKCTRTRTVTAQKRGVFRMEDVTLVVSDLLGLVSVSKRISIDEQVTILPVPYEVREGELSAEELSGELLARRYICDDPFMISGAREYTGREPMNRIHWRSTAKSGQIMAFNNDFTTTNRAAVVLNMQRRATGEPEALIDGDLETYIKACAFLFDMLYRKHADVRFLTNGNGGIYSDGGKEQDGELMLLRSLALIENEKPETDIAEFLSETDFSDRTDIFIITAYIDEKMLGFAEKQKHSGRNVIFYCNNEVDTSYRIIRLGRVNKFYYTVD